MLSLILMLTVLAGCGAQTGTNNSPNKTGTNNTTPLKVGMDLKYPPFTGMDASGNPEGLEVDIAKSFGKYLGREVKIVNTDFSMMIAALEIGEVDILISDMTIKEERKEKVDFSDPYLYGRTLALVNKKFAEKNSITDTTTI